MKCRCDSFIEPTIKSAIIYFVVGLCLYFIQIVIDGYYNDLEYILSRLSLFVINISIFMFLFSYLFEYILRDETKFKKKMCCFYNFLIFFTFIIHITVGIKN